MVAQCTGLRISEILGLQWGDFDFEAQTFMVQRSSVVGRIDAAKTEYSKDYVPLDPRLEELLLRWRSFSIYSKDADWVILTDGDVMERLTEAILERTSALPEGAPVSAKMLLHLGTRPALDQSLSRLARRGKLWSSEASFTAEELERVS